MILAYDIPAEHITVDLDGGNIVLVTAPAAGENVKSPQEARVADAWISRIDTTSGETVFTQTEGARPASLVVTLAALSDHIDGSKRYNVSIALDEAELLTLSPEAEAFWIGVEVRNPVPVAFAIPYVPSTVTWDTAFPPPVYALNPADFDSLIAGFDTEAVEYSNHAAPFSLPGKTAFVTATSNATLFTQDGGTGYETDAATGRHRYRFLDLNYSGLKIDGDLPLVEQNRGGSVIRCGSISTYYNPNDGDVGIRIINHIASTSAKFQVWFDKGTKNIHFRTPTDSGVFVPSEVVGLNYHLFEVHRQPDKSWTVWMAGVLQGTIPPFDLPETFSFSVVGMDPTYEQYDRSAIQSVFVFDDTLTNNQQLGIRKWYAENRQARYQIPLPVIA